MNEQNNNQLAALPRRSRRLAAIMPVSYWISIGYSEEDAQRMERLQNNIKKYCEDGGETDILTNSRFHYARLFGLGTPYHELMLPHWKKFAKSLKLNGHNSVNEVQIVGISTPVTVLDILFPTLQTMNLGTLRLYEVGLGSDEYTCLSSFLKGNTSLEKLVLGCDTIHDLSNATSLSDAISNHPTLEAVVFYNCGFDAAGFLEIILQGCKRLNEVVIMNDDLGSEVRVISEFISSNHPVGFLNLGRNEITDTNTDLLALALKKNTNLKTLDLEENYMTEEGEKALLNALFDPTSMDSIVTSNHLCRIYTYDINDSLIVAQRAPLEQEVLKINRGDYSVKQKIRKKVVLALCRQDGVLFDLSHLNDLPLKLMPRVLELIQEHTTNRRSRNTPVQLEKDALSRLFHTLRGWELPLLFENLNRPSNNGGKRKKRKIRRH